MALLARAAFPWRVPSALVLLALLLGAFVSLSLQQSSDHTTLAVPGEGMHRPMAAGALSRLPAGARLAVSGALGGDALAYRVRSDGGALRATNAAQGLNTRFDASGVVVDSGPARVGLRLDAIGYGTSLQSVGPARPRASANRVLYRHGGVREWYANGPLGLEQGFTVVRAPNARATGALTLGLALTGTARGTLSADRRSITFDLGGGRALRYDGLLATDASGRALRSWLVLDGRRLLIRTDVRGARFPLRVDPLIQQGSKLTGHEEAGTSELGTSVALSADGNTALVGGPGDSGMTGAAWVFTRSGTTWTQQGPKLTGSGEEGEGQFGISVALSGDGNTALIGAINDQTGKVELGAAWVFTRSGSTWTQQGAKLTGEGEVGSGRFGRSVALSSSGDTALVGGYFDNASQGAAWVFTRSGSTWKEQGPKLTPSDEEGAGQVGFSAALSGDGNTALIGAPSDEGGRKVLMTGAAWVFTRSGSTWKQQGSKLTGAGEEGSGEYGAAAALSADGATALLGGPGDGTVGAAWAFTRSSGVWSQQGQKLTPNDATTGASFGAGVALSDAGDTALIGGPVDKGSAVPTGAAWEFARGGSSWSQRASKLQGGGWAPESEFGLGVALSADGDTGLVGGPIDNTDLGAAWPFVNPPPAVTTQAATNVGFAAANLNGTVAAGASNSVFFQFGSTSAYGSATPQQALGAADSSRAMTFPLGGLIFGTAYHFRIVAQNSAGTSFGADQTFTTTAPGGKEALVPPPSITRATQSRRVWREGKRAASIAGRAPRRRRPPLGTSFSFALDQRAGVALVFTQTAPGRRVGHRCLSQTRSNRRRRACKRVLTRGALSLAAHAGRDTISFQGVLQGARRLRPGTYTVHITATNAQRERSNTVALTFRIVR